MIQMKVREPYFTYVTLIDTFRSSKKCFDEIAPRKQKCVRAEVLESLDGLSSRSLGKKNKDIVSG